MYKNFPTKYIIMKKFYFSFLALFGKRKVDHNGLQQEAQQWLGI